MQQTRPAPLSTSTALTADVLPAFDGSLLTSRSAVRRPALPHLVVRPVLVARAAAGGLQAGSEQTRHRPFWGRVIRPIRCEMTTAGSERQSESCPFCGPDWRRAWPCRRDRRCRASTAAVRGRTSTCSTGSPVLQPEPGQVAFFPNIDAIDEFRIESNSPPAEFGRFNGGVVNLTTRAGTNQLHGSAFEFLRHESLNARNYFAPTGPKPEFRRNQFGGVVGGPIRKDRARSSSATTRGNDRTSAGP